MLSSVHAEAMSFIVNKDSHFMFVQFHEGRLNSHFKSRFTLSGKRKKNVVIDVCMQTLVLLLPQSYLLGDSRLFEQLLHQKNGFYLLDYTVSHLCITYREKYIFFPLCFQYFIYCCILGLVSCSVFLRINYELKMVVMLVAVVIYNIIILQTHASLLDGFSKALYPTNELDRYTCKERRQTCTHTHIHVSV